LLTVKVGSLELWEFEERSRNGIHDS